MLGQLWSSAVGLNMHTVSEGSSKPVALLVQSWSDRWEDSWCSLLLGKANYMGEALV